MEETWGTFIQAFCKVEFLCYAGEPNWLGWGVIGFGGMIILGIITSILSAIVDG
jgi:hypothetical protein